MRQGLLHNKGISSAQDKDMLSLLVSYFSIIETFLIIIKKERNGCKQGIIYRLVLLKALPIYGNSLRS